MGDGRRAQGNESRLKGELRVAIRRARERLQLNQEDFARELGEFLGHPISQSQISDWERGRFEPSATVLLAVAELADVSVDQLRGTGPSLFLDRMERLEGQVDRLSQEVEEESKNTGKLLAQIIEVLDQAGLWSGSKPAADLRRDRSR
jgi:transcriptional regulator with XRE-family HTH domain